MNSKINKTLQLFTNTVLCHIPSRHFRLNIYRLMGAKIGKSIIFRRTEILDPQNLEIRNHCSIGWHYLIDARGGVKISDNVNISSYVKIITAGHDVKSSSFQVIEAPVQIERNVWLATGCTILEGVHIGEGTVVAAGALVTKDIEPYAVVGGIPAKKITERTKELNYQVALPPILY